MIFHLIPHTHWDREWYLPRAAFQARLVPMLDDLLEQLERDPGARFVLDGQTVLLEDYLAARPEAVERVAAAVQLGALDVGPWYVLADLLIPSGESLLRNLQEGARDAKRFGRRLRVLYSPDAFGHPAVLPALAAQFGMGSGVIRRGLGRPAGADRDLHRWEAPDGSGLLVYHLPRAGYEVAIEATRAGADLAREWAAVRGELVARAATDQIAVFIGADHHPAPDLAAFRARLQALEPEHEVRISGLAEYFTAVARRTEIPATIRGELRRIDAHTWTLQGVHSTRSRQKRRFSLAELHLLRVAEPLAALALWRNGEDLRPQLRLGWRTLLQAQFHDTLCGSCCDDVAREQDVRLGAVEAVSREVASRGLHVLAGHDPDAAREHPERAAPGLVLWNPCSRERAGIITAELTFFRRDVLVGPLTGGRRRRGSGWGHRPVALRGPEGEMIPVQVLAARRDHERIDARRHHPDQDEVDRVFVAFRAPAVPGLGIATLAPLGSRKPPAGDLLVDEGRLANRHLEVRLEGHGGLALRDRRTGQEYEGLLEVQDEPDGGDTYTYSAGRGRSVRGRARAGRVVLRGPLVGAVESRWSMASAGKGDLECRLLVVLHDDSPLVRLRLDVDNRATDHRLRARFRVGAGSDALAGAAFGVEQRGPAPDARPGPALERVAPTAPAHRFVAVAEGDRGLAVFAPGFFEYEWTPARDLLLTLFRSVGELSRGTLPERPGHAGWPLPTPLAQEPGGHVIPLAVAVVGAGEPARADRLERLWEDAFLPIQAVFLRDFSGGRTAPPRGLTLEGEGLVLSGVMPQPGGGGLVLRCYNATDVATIGRWILDRPLARAARMRADDTELDELAPGHDRRSVRFAAGPREIVTLTLTAAPAT